MFDSFQNSLLKARLSPCINVSGVGHQTAKRLQALGVVSVGDLQLCQLKELVKDFGGPTAQRLKNLACGIDDSPVTPTGAPQVQQKILSLRFPFVLLMFWFIWIHSTDLRSNINHWSIRFCCPVPCINHCTPSALIDIMGASMFCE